MTVSKNGFTTFKLAPAEMKSKKLTLKKDGYPIASCRRFVEESMRDKILLPEDSVLYLVPSTSGQNILPMLMADKLKEWNPSVRIEDDFAVPLQITTSKKKGIVGKIEDPVRYNFVNLDKHEKPCFIVDDVLTTGESVERIREKLFSEQLDYHGTVTISQSELYLTYKTDITRTAKKLAIEARHLIIMCLPYFLNLAGNEVDQLAGVNSSRGGTQKNFYFLDEGEKI